jgi:hypothetical protein
VVEKGYGGIWESPGNPLAPHIRGALDMVEEARVLLDRGGFFQAKLENLRQRLGELSARKVRFKGGSYWILKPDYRPGDVIEL